ncbi:MAG: hypothetical protein SNJ82_11800 [Gemmataceae bacterium]
MRTKQPCSLGLLASVFLLGAIGCGNSAPVPTYPTSGSVIYDGKPAKGVQVFLLPTSAPIVPQVPQNPYGITDELGRFRLTTYGDFDGAAEGGYQVVLLWPDENAAEEAEGASQDRFLGWYDATRSQLTVNIKTGINELPAFKIPKVTRPPEELKGVPGRN